ncbi:MAG: M24 family metallopeptidase [Planctomycetota bacterium]|nr:M24 family metallopeptidase [Planctomycetota bacterium]
MVASAVAARVGLAECFDAGRATTRALLAGVGAVRAGATTLEVARAAEAELSRVGAIGVRGVPQGRGGPAFPEACIVCVNDVAADGIPGARVLCAGDVVTIDAPACVRVGQDFAWADAAVSLTVPDERKFSARREVDLASASCAVVRAIVGEMRAGGRWSAAAAAGRARASELGVAIVEALDGHGIGRAMHQPPRLALTPLRGREGSAGEVGEVELKAGMLLAVEAVVAERAIGNAETVRTRTDVDGWSERTEGGERAAGWEVTVRIERDGARLVAGLLGGLEALGFAMFGAGRVAGEGFRT